jgi:hypothetical protein
MSKGRATNCRTVCRWLCIALTSGTDVSLRSFASRGEKTRGGPPASELDKWRIIPHCIKKTACYEVLHKVSELMGPYEHGN